MGYQGGEGALIRMGALDMGLTLDELNPIKEAWRAANLRIAGQSYKDQPPGFWERMNDAAMAALRRPGSHEVDHGISFRKENGILFMRLPAGRDLCYVKPSIQEGNYGPEVHFWGLDQMTKQWVEQKSYGGRWTENFCQAFSRDLLYLKLKRMEEEGLHQYVRFHVHDEVVPSIPLHGARDTLLRIQDIFAEPVEWAPGLPLRGDGFLTPFFRKDD
jgi:DNA polymerase